MQYSSVHRALEELTLLGIGRPLSPDSAREQSPADLLLTSVGLPLALAPVMQIDAKHTAARYASAADGVTVPPGPEDAAGLQLMRAMARGDKSALATLYEREARSLLGYLIELTRDRQLAEDILQDTFLAAWRGAQSFRGRSRVRTWLFAIARRQARDRRRGTTRLVELAEEVMTASATQDPRDIALARVALSELSERIRTLSVAHREVISLNAVHGLSYQEIADVLEVPLGTVKSRLSNARRLLRIVATRGEDHR